MSFFLKYLPYLEVYKKLLLIEFDVSDVNDVDFPVDIAEEKEAGGEVERDDGVIILGLEVDHARRLICCKHKLFSLSGF
jgi:hypothetical protein